MNPTQIKNVLKTQMNISYLDFGRPSFRRNELLCWASGNEALLEDVLREWEKAGYLWRTVDGGAILSKAIEVHIH